ncbi:MAG: DEAD/DEAH box helicase [Clostridia bacterium]|nr:DEAD/DEAH box helicase [Clostridia bacterium]
MKFEAKYYQQYCIDKIIEQPKLGLLLDMGMGKTVITLTAVERLVYDYFSVRKVLVIAPLKPAIETWPTEVEKWNHLKHIITSLVLGDKESRLNALEKDAELYIVNRENVQWLVDYYKKKWPFDMVVIDELSSFKSSKAQRFKALKKVRPYIKRIVGLTGTPSPNGLLDLWSQMYLLDAGEALGKTITSYKEKWFVPDKRNATTIFSWKPKDGAEEEIYKKLEPLCISMKTADYLQLPERIDIRHEIETSSTTMDLYKKLERDMILPYEDGDIDAGSAAILVNKLLQVAGGAAYDENGNIKILHNEKLDALDVLLEEANGQPVLLFYSYRHERDRIIERHPEAVDVKEDTAVKEWNAGNIPLLLAHPASAGHGLNLQFGGHIVIWYGLPCSLELYQQANKRVHRMGQKETVLIHHLLMKNTADMWVLDQVLTEKDKRQNALLEALKARIREVKE